MPPKRVASKAVSLRKSSARCEDRSAALSHSQTTTTSDSRVDAVSVARNRTDKQVVDQKLEVERQREAMSRQILQKLQRDFENERARWKDREQELMRQIAQQAKQIEDGIVAEWDSDKQAQEQQRKIDCMEEELRESYRLQRLARDDFKMVEENAARYERDVQISRREMETCRRDYVRMKTELQEEVRDLDARLRDAEKELMSIREMNAFLVNTPTGQLGQQLHDAQKRIMELENMVYPQPPSCYHSFDEADQYRGPMSPNYGNDDSFERQDPHEMPRLGSGRDSRLTYDRPDGHRNRWNDDMGRGMMDGGRDGGYRHHSMDRRGDGGRDGEAGRYRHQHWNGGDRAGGRDGNTERYRQHPMNELDQLLDGGGNGDAARYRCSINDQGGRFDGGREGNPERYREPSMEYDMANDRRATQPPRYRHSMGGAMNDEREATQSRHRHSMDDMGGAMNDDRETSRSRHRHSMGHTGRAINDEREASQSIHRYHSMDGMGRAMNDGRETSQPRHGYQSEDMGGGMNNRRENSQSRHRHQSMAGEMGGAMNDERETSQLRHRYQSGDMGGGMNDGRENSQSRHRHQSMAGEMGGAMNDERETSQSRHRYQSGDMGGEMNDGRENSPARYKHSMDNTAGRMPHDGREKSQSRYRDDSMSGGMPHDGRDGSQLAYGHPMSAMSGGAEAGQPPKVPRREQSIDGENIARNRRPSMIELNEEESGEPKEKRRREMDGAETRCVEDHQQQADDASTVAMMGGRKVFRVRSEEPQQPADNGPVDGNTTETFQVKKEVKKEAVEQPQPVNPLDYPHPSFRASFEAHNRMLNRIRHKDA